MYRTKSALNLVKAGSVLFLWLLELGIGKGRGLHLVPHALHFKTYAIVFRHIIIII